jgi:hypothetical protein
MAQVIALMAPVALGLSGATFHEPFHAGGMWRPMIVTKRSDREHVTAMRQLEGVAIRESSCVLLALPN